MDLNIQMRIPLGAELQRQIFNMQKRILKDGSNPFEIPDEIFRGLYRLPKGIAINVIEELQPFLENPIRVTAMPNHLKSPKMETY